MEIVKFKKIKGNIYELEFDNGVLLKLYDDVIVKYNLLVNKVVDDKSLKEISEYNDSLDAYYLSIKYINKKLRCEKEIKDYLIKKSFELDVIDKTIFKLKASGYLNRKLYIMSYINDSFMFNNDGPVKIRHNLNSLGFLDDEIDIYLDKDFREKAIRIIDKKVKTNHKYSNNMLKQYITNYLVNLGYPKNLFIDYLSGIETDNKELLVKDAKLFIKKYAKKYEKDKLMYFIKDKLYKKGYNIEEICEVLENELL